MKERIRREAPVVLHSRQLRSGGVVLAVTGSILMALSALGGLAAIVVYALFTDPAFHVYAKGESTTDADLMLAAVLAICGVGFLGGTACLIAGLRQAQTGADPPGPSAHRLNQAGRAPGPRP